MERVSLSDRLVVCRDDEELAVNRLGSLNHLIKLCRTVISYTAPCDRRYCRGLSEFIKNAKEEKKFLINEIKGKLK